MNKKWNAFVAMHCFWVAGVAHAELSAQAIMEKNEATQKVRTSQADGTIKVQDGSEEKTKSFTWWRKLQDNKTHFDTITRFHKPASIKGEATLFLEAESGDDEILLYLPKFKKTRRVEVQQQSGKFMGSHFSYFDMTSFHAKDFKYDLKKKMECGVGEKAKGQCYWIEAKPANDRIRKKCGYDRSLAWIREDNFMVVKSEFYRDGEQKPYKTLLIDKQIEVDSKEKKWMALWLKATDHKSGESSTLEFKNQKTNITLDSKLFSREALAQ